MSAPSPLAASLRELHHPVKWLKHPDTENFAPTMEVIQAELLDAGVEITPLELALVSEVLFCEHCLAFTKPAPDDGGGYWPFPATARWPCATASLLVLDGVA